MTIARRTATSLVVAAWLGSHPAVIATQAENAAIAAPPTAAPQDKSSDNADADAPSVSYMAILRAAARTPAELETVAAVLKAAYPALSDAVDSAVERLLAGDDPVLADGSSDAGQTSDAVPDAAADAAPRELAVASAAETVTEAAADDALPERARGFLHLPSWKPEIELGAGAATGDTDETSLALGIVFARDFRNGIGQTIELEADLARRQGVTTRERLVGRFDTRYPAASSTYLANSLTVEVDRFTGFDYRIADTIGVGRTLYSSDRQTLKGIAGPGIRVARLREDDPSRGLFAGDTITEFIGRLELDYALTLTDAWSLKNRAIGLLGSDNSSFDNRVSLEGTITDRLAARFSFRVNVESNPPLGSAGTDTETNASLVYAF